MKKIGGLRKRWLMNTVAVIFVLGMVLTIVGWKMTGELLGLGIMLVGMVFLLTALFVYNALYKK